MAVNSKMRGLVPRRKPDPSRAKPVAQKVVFPVPVSVQIAETTLDPGVEKQLCWYAFPETAVVKEAVVVMKQKSEGVELVVYHNEDRLYSVPVSEEPVLLAADMEVAQYDHVTVAAVTHGDVPVTFGPGSVCMVTETIRETMAMKALRKEKEDNERHADIR